MKESEALKVVNDLSHDALSFQCKNCDFSSKTRKNLKKHISKNSIQQRKISKEDGSSNQFVT